MDTLVVFVTDSGFLVPSLVAASQLVKQRIHDIADIMIYTVNVDATILSQLRVKNPHLQFRDLPAHLFTPPDTVTFTQNHVPVTSLARLSLQEVMDPNYKRIIYIDGDVQVVGDVRSLITCIVPDGKIMAGRGSAWLDDGKDEDATPRGYLEALGDISHASYFNAGILAFSAETWKDKAPKALNFFFENSAVCIRHDQSALNAVFNGNVVHLPPKYNFHSKYSELGVQRKYPPAIIHFTGPNKPWGRPASPWWGSFKKSYAEVVRQQPYLAGFLKINDEGDIKTTLRQVKSRLKKSLNARNSDDEAIDEKAARFFAYVSRTDFPC